MPYSDHEQALRVASALSAVATGCCLRYGLFVSILRQPMIPVEAEEEAFIHYYDLLRTIPALESRGPVSYTLIAR